MLFSNSKIRDKDLEKRGRMRLVSKNTAFGDNDLVLKSSKDS